MSNSRPIYATEGGVARITPDRRSAASARLGPGPGEASAPVHGAAQSSAMDPGSGES